MVRISSASARDTASASTRDRASTNANASNRELEIIEKFLHSHHLLVHKVQNRDSTSIGDSASTRDRDSTRDSASDRELEIIEVSTSPSPLSAQSLK